VSLAVKSLLPFIEALNIETPGVVLENGPPLLRLGTMASCAIQLFAGLNRNYSCPRVPDIGNVRARVENRSGFTAAEDFYSTADWSPLSDDAKNSR